MVSSSDDDIPLSKVRERRNAGRSTKKPPPIKGPLSLKLTDANDKVKAPAKRKRAAQKIWTAATMTVMRNTLPRRNPERPRKCLPDENKPLSTRKLRTK
jgi:hypothetical protein